MSRSSADSADGGFGRLAREFLLYVLAAMGIPIAVAMASFAVLPAGLAGPVGVAPAALACVLVLGSVGKRSYSPATIGRTKSVEDSKFVGESEHCVECDGEIDRGVKRQFREQIVLCGYPIYTTESGANPYCPWCAEHLDSPLAESSEDPTHATESERLSETNAPN